MRLIVGLGNPGKVYSQTRHNIGSSIVKAIAKEYKVSLKKGIFSSCLNARLRILDQDVILAVPLVFMNLSGDAVRSLVKKHRVALENLLVVFDDLDLELGRLKVKPDGSSGGHNGLKSIISSLGSQNFCRLRIGIGRPQDQRADIARYVLSPFSKKEKNIVEQVTEISCQVVEFWVSQGISKTMNIFNQGQTLFFYNKADSYEKIVSVPNKTA